MKDTSNPLKKHMHNKTFPAKNPGDKKQPTAQKNPTKLKRDRTPQHHVGENTATHQT
ncbi:hypothetical protein [Pacificibacter marinus]|uniref:hypothetical protein n=1 Tax=Pacificibacter marinus TaxID=658057 RepID=UPI00147C93D1|nr:hypothetical protein [Pacificibacter marinus]